MSGNEDVFRFQEGSVLFFIVVSDSGANLDDILVPLLLPRTSWVER